MALPDLRTPSAAGFADSFEDTAPFEGFGFPDLDHTALAVKGAVPPELDGTLFRIGPEAGRPYVSALRLRHGHAEWFRARRIRTDEVCRQNGELPSPGPRRCASDDTSAALIRHNRRTLALGDAALPYELAPDLRTRARWDFDGTLPAGFTSQAVHDPLTGELYAAIAGARTLDYAVVDVQGSVRAYDADPDAARSGAVRPGPDRPARGVLRAGRCRDHAARGRRGRRGLDRRRRAPSRDRGRRAVR